MRGMVVVISKTALRQRPAGAYEIEANTIGLPDNRWPGTVLVDDTAFRHLATDEAGGMYLSGDMDVLLINRSTLRPDETEAR